MLICTLKSKNLKTFPKKPRFFSSPGCIRRMRVVAFDVGRSEKHIMPYRHWQLSHDHVDENKLTMTLAKRL